MADPLSISAGVIGTLAFALHSARRTISFIDSVRGAPAAVRALSTDLYALEHVLGTLGELLNHPDFRDNPRRLDFIALLRNPLQLCTATLDSILGRLKPFTRPTGDARTSKWRGFSWFLHEKDILSLQKTLTNHKASLEIAIAVVNLANTTNGLSDVKKQINKLHKRLVEEESSTCDTEVEGSTSEGTDRGFAIKRFLLETESILGVSPPESPRPDPFKPSSVLPATLDWPLHDLPILAAPMPLESPSSTVAASVARDSTQPNDNISPIPETEIGEAVSLPTVTESDKPTFIRHTTNFRRPLEASPHLANNFHTRSSSEATLTGLATPFNPSRQMPSAIHRTSLPLRASETVENTTIRLESEKPTSTDALDPTSRPTILDALPKQLPEIGNRQKSSTRSKTTLIKTFGVSLEVLFERDECLVPVFVHQCIRVIDQWGLRVHGVYNMSGSNSLLAAIKQRFDEPNLNISDAERTSATFDFEICQNEIPTVAASLKQFFRELPIPLLPPDHYDAFIKAAQIEDDLSRRKRIHEIVNTLDDIHFATLRALSFHLHRVHENAAKNGMNARNIGIAFGPTLLSSSISDIRDINWHVRILEEIILTAHDIFDESDMLNDPFPYR